MMTSPSESGTLSRRLTELHEQRRAAILELKALSDRQERVPLAHVPVVGSALRALKRMYILPLMQAWQQAVNQLGLDETEMVALEMADRIDSALRRIGDLETNQAALKTYTWQIGSALTQLQQSSAGLGANLNQVNDAVSGIQQSYSSLSGHVGQLDAGLTELQGTHTELGGHIKQLDVALSGIQQAHAGLGGHVVQVNHALTSLQHAYNQLTELVIPLQHLRDQVAIQSENVRRLGAQISYLPGSINELVADLRRDIEQVAADSRTSVSPPNPQ